LAFEEQNIGAYSFYLLFSFRLACTLSSGLLGFYLYSIAHHQDLFGAGVVDIHRLLYDGKWQRLSGRDLREESATHLARLVLSPVPKRLLADQPLPGHPLDQLGDLAEAQAVTVVQAQLPQPSAYKILARPLQIVARRPIGQHKAPLGELEGAVNGPDSDTLGSVKA
jgi:hypothetical protein